MKVLFVKSVGDDNTEGKVARAIYEKNASSMKMVERKDGLFNVLSKIKQNDIIVFHQPAIKSVFSIISSRLLRKKTLCLIWDSYPVIIDSRRYDNRLVRVIADLIENVLLYIVGQNVVPSSDFLVRYPNARKKYFWPKVVIPVFEKKNKLEKKDTVRILFAGQINLTRDLFSAYKEIGSKIEGPYELIICSSDTPCNELLAKSNVRYLGFLKHDDLASIARNCHFGLVSVNSKLVGPALPSKTYDYLKHGLSVMYYGPFLRSYVTSLEQSGVGIVIKNHQLMTRKFLQKQLDCEIGKIKKYESLMMENDVKDIEYL